MGLQKTWDGLPPWAKGVAAVAVTGITVATIWTIYDQIKKRIAGASGRVETAAINNDLAVASAANPSTLTASQLTGFVDQLKEAFGGLTTDETAVYNVFDQMKNLTDVLSLQKAYGTQSIVTTLPFGGFTGTLSATLTRYISASSPFHKSLADINDNLAKKGINIRF